jgi:hypothetical protein
MTRVVRKYQAVWSTDYKDIPVVIVDTYAEHGIVHYLVHERKGENFGLPADRAVILKGDEKR